MSLRIPLNGCAMNEKQLADEIDAIRSQLKTSFAACLAASATLFASAAAIGSDLDLLLGLPMLLLLTYLSCMVLSLGTGLLLACLMLDHLPSNG